MELSSSRVLVTLRTMKEPWKVTCFCLCLQSKSFHTLMNIYAKWEGKGLRAFGVGDWPVSTLTSSENATLAVPSLLGLFGSLSLLKQKATSLFPETPENVFEWGVRSPDWEEREDSLDSRSSPSHTAASVLARKCPS